MWFPVAACISPSFGPFTEAAMEEDGNESVVDAPEGFFARLVPERDLNNCVKDVVRLKKPCRSS